MDELPLADELKSFALSAVSAVEGALIVARIVRPNTDVEWCRAELRYLAGEAGSGAAPAELVDYLRAQGFAGAEAYYDADNSSLECVLRTRRGIPITLAMVVVGTAECLGMTATGINFPGHFMVSLDGRLFDPFKMQPINAAGRRTWLTWSGADEKIAFKSATPVDVVLRMLNNLRALARSRGDHESALELTNYQLIVSPDPLPIHVDRAELWAALGVSEMAKRELESAIALAPDVALRAQLEERLHGLDASGPTLH
ncbi:MAG: transglutaminase family protein [Pseudomonadota bacterium]|nr:transglutaminase family protein [Pseudomonadota bacterium]